MSAADTPLTKYHPKVCTEKRKHIHKHNKTLININIHCTIAFAKFPKSQSSDKKFMTDYTLTPCGTDNHRRKHTLISDAKNSDILITVAAMEGWNILGSEWATGSWSWSWKQEKWVQKIAKEERQERPSLINACGEWGLVCVVWSHIRPTAG